MHIKNIKIVNKMFISNNKQDKCIFLRILGILIFNI